MGEPTFSVQAFNGTGERQPKAEEFVFPEGAPKGSEGDAIAASKAANEKVTALLASDEAPAEFEGVWFGVVPA